MMILARPSISPYLTRTLAELEVPVLLAEDFVIPMRPAINIRTLEEVRRDPKRAYQSLILTSSENALSFLYKWVPHDDRVLKARLFKDKGVFRRALAAQFPDYFFREVPLAELGKVKPAELPFPIILKPAVGISSIGVIRVGEASEWDAALAFVRKELESYQQNYSAAVVEGATFIIEKFIQGTELAIDGYFNSRAEPVVLNILEHLFADDRDTSDRLYYTSRPLLERNYDRIFAFLERFGDAFDLKRFPFHLEVRCTPDGQIIPIELNPLRFSGLGTTEIAEYAYAINVYRCFFREEKPEWSRILGRSDNSVYSFMCADVPAELFRSDGLRVDDRRLHQEFGEVLDYRILSETETSTFAVVFFRSPDLEEPKRFLTVDLRRYLTSGR